MLPDLSIIIPAYNRIEILKYTLESVQRAIQDFTVEIIVVDDGSQIPLSDYLQNFLSLPINFIRQNNQGSIVARNRGFREAKGRYVLFLDSDDLLHPDKLVVQIKHIEETQSDVCYTDEAVTTLQGNYTDLVFKPKRVLSTVQESARFYLQVQPLPSNPIYKKSYLDKYLTKPLVSANRLYDSVGDVWLYYNLAAYPAKITKLNGYYCVYGEHEGERYTNHWENLGVASLALMLAFSKNCPVNESTLEARRLVGECALISWRKLPKNFNLDFEKKMWSIWKESPKGDLQNLGGKNFQILAKLLGVRNAAFILRYLQRPDYAKIQTISRQELSNKVSSIDNI
ncbi:glycosyltransferase family 2 protein [Nostoc spongiaeforme FACHB-130]|uniref:Glycosyltransferase family 2 protein n=1 Tax=Nostoc spongiaeforme FACHB-130 TaxID=1357510 RepID=A0ABR8FRA7_9NOSO|nr:glycosyltransferase family A protein [Nostoc spongiaeforme]MBD2593974.1 glycosyltransferase family 2 protein [Nostoc spongiaeforme FACHB-130]